mmetsp:Transcript_85093/g.177851  ORF Transcript_85093/g.177851 Transcript_85093/m.177851 type:complete len:236 (-) Transcript_85093:160-867(-)
MKLGSHRQTGLLQAVVEAEIAPLFGPRRRFSQKRRKMTTTTWRQQQRPCRQSSFEPMGEGPRAGDPCQGKPHHRLWSGQRWRRPRPRPRLLLLLEGEGPDLLEHSTLVDRVLPMVGLLGPLRRSMGLLACPPHRQRQPPSAPECHELREAEHFRSASVSAPEKFELHGSPFVQHLLPQSCRRTPAVESDAEVPLPQPSAAGPPPLRRPKHCSIGPPCLRSRMRSPSGEGARDRPL